MLHRSGWLVTSVVWLGLTIGFLVLGAVLLPPGERRTVPRNGTGADVSSAP